MKQFYALSTVWGILLAFLPLRTMAQDTTAWQKVIAGQYSPAQKAAAGEKLALYFQQQKQFDRAFEWAQKSIQAARQTQNDSLIFRQYSLLSTLQEETGDMEEAIVTLNQYLMSAGKRRKSENDANALNNIGVLYGKLNDYARQTEYYIRAQKIYEVLGRSIQASKVTVNLAQVYVNIGNSQEAIRNLRSLLENTKDKALNDAARCNIYSTLATAYLVTKKPDSAFYFSGLEIAAAKRTDNPNLLFNAWQKRSSFLLQSGDMNAVKLANDSMLYYAQKSGNLSKEGISYSNLGMYYAFLPGGMPQARDYFEKALAIGQQMNDLKFRVNSLNNLAAAYAALGEHAQAYGFQEKAYQLLKDSLITNAGQEKVAEMQARFQAEKKEARIKLLDEKNKLQKRTTYFLVAVLGLFAVLCFSLYRNMKNKQRTNQKLNTLNRSLEEANQTKAKLFSILSHDLRSPISQVYQFLRLQQMENVPLSQEQKQSLNHKIQTATSSLLETMEDLLLWSKTQLDQFEPKENKVILRELVAECIRLLQLNIEAKELNVINQIPEQTLVQTDAYFLRTIIRNLLQNAIKAAPDKSSVTIVFENNILSIENDGQPFTQADYEQAISNNASQNPLSGLGLKLVAELSGRTGIGIQFDKGRTAATAAHIVFRA